MNKLLTSKYGWIAWLLLLVALNFLAAQFHYRLDLTQEKRFTLSDPTRNLLGNLDDQVSVDFFLKGDLKAGAHSMAFALRPVFKDQFNAWVILVFQGQFASTINRVAFHNDNLQLKAR